MLQAEHPALVLASGSAARRALLRAAGLRFAVRPVALDEDAVRRDARDEGATADAAALRLAELKARAADEAGTLVIGADQILGCDGEWFSKPADAAAARAQLLRLRGRTHTLHTAVCCVQAGALVWHHVAQPRLRMRAFSEPFLDAYLAAEGAQATATVGAYRLEDGPGVHLFERVEGEHAAILGLPLLPLLTFLRRHGVLGE